jgi:DNA-binding CsgD family transcriptional regulator
VLHDNNGWGVAQTRYGFGALARARGDHAAALRHFGEALALYREIDARPEIARCLAGLGWVALAQQDLQLARSSLTECLQLSLATGQRLAIARCLEAFALLTAAQGGDPVRAVKLQGAALALREAIGPVPSSPARTRLRQRLESARGQLGEAAAAALLDQGRALTGYEAARLAIGTSDELAGDRPPADRLPLAAQPQDGSGAGAFSQLTVRELEIAALIARGLSNRGIADELVISPATAARHVANIFTKLGFSSRAQVAAWVVERESAGRD